MIAPAPFTTQRGGRRVPSQGGTNIPAISANQSWLVPYESPYAAAWQAFLRAAIYHFNNLNILGTGRNQTVSQIGYIRPGISSGGEAVPLCTLKTPMTNANPAFSKSVWVSWYATVNSAIQAANPRMQILYSINSSDPQFPNADYATQEAGTAVSYGNSTGILITVLAVRDWRKRTLALTRLAVPTILPSLTPATIGGACLRNIGPEAPAPSEA